jgi:uncharacterized protein
MTAMLSAWNEDILRHVLARHADTIESVGVFGSRATGTARAASDIDLVIHGPMPQAGVDRLVTELGESLLSITADVVVYDRLDHPALKAHIDRVAIPLFTRQALRATA